MNRPCPSLLTSLVLSLGLALVLALALAFALAMAFADVPALASQQSQQAQPAQQTPPEKEKPDARRPKKVWTNDDMQGLGGTSGVSVVGGGSAAAGGVRDNAAAQPKGSAKEKDPNWYRQQLAPLRSELERLDKEIVRTREFINGEHTGEGRLKVNVFSVPMNPADQIAQLEKRKATTQTKIDALEDLARRNDIPPGALR